MNECSPYVISVMNEYSPYLISVYLFVYNEYSYQPGFLVGFFGKSFTFTIF